MEDIKFVVPKIEQIDKIKAFIDEFTINGEVKISGSCGLMKYDDVAEWIDYVNLVSQGKVDNRVQSDVLFAKRLSDGKLMAIVDIRHVLQPQYYHDGHIGVSIIPSERNKGYGTKVLKLAIGKCHELGVLSPVVTCNQDNYSSKKMIEKAGGEFIEPFLEDSGNIVLIYQMTK